MGADSQLVTVYRSADPSAEEEAASVRDYLSESGLHPAMFFDSEPGVPEGAVEVRVPPEEESSAERLIAELQLTSEEPELQGDDSSDLDLVTVYEGAGAIGEVEAISVRGLLDSAGIPSVLIGTTPIPNLPFVVKVPRNMEVVARTAIEVAKAAGPEAAELAERSSEPGN
jgi:hypothetical protein